MPGYAVVLDGSQVDPATIGGKAAALDRLIAWGQRVPPTAVVTARSFRVVVEQPELVDLMGRLAGKQHISAFDVDAAFLAARVPIDVLDEIMTVARQVGNGGPLAIRSSATVEDLAQSSFAGQYRSVLNVASTDRNAVERAVLEVFASLFHPAPRAYRDALGISGAGIAMAAVMMAMVDADRAGVLFTLDPTVAAPMLRIEVVDGLGDSLVSGAVTPRVYQVARTDEPADFVFDSSLDECLLGVVEAGLEIERRAGVAQDIEWAWDGSTLWIVQARPVTAHRSATFDQVVVDPFDDDLADLDDVELTTEGIGEMLPGVLPPLVWQVASFIVEEAFRVMLDRLGANLADAVESRWLVRRVQGRAAIDVERLSAVMDPIPGAAQRVRAAYFGEGTTEPNSDTAPPAASLRERVAGRVLVASHLRQAAVSRRRASFDAEVVSCAVISLRPADDLASATTAQLLARHLELLTLSARAMTAELTVSADAGAIHSAVGSLLERYLPYADARQWTDHVTVPAPLPPALGRGSAAVFAGPTWDELGLVPAVRSHDHDAGSLLDALEVLLGSTPNWPANGLRRRAVRRRLSHLVRDARIQFGRRETTKAAILVLGGEVRRIHLELGQRLVGEGRLRDALDIDLLTVAEIRAYLTTSDRGVAVEPTRREVDRRRRVIQRQRAGSPLPSRWRGVPTDERRVAVSTEAGAMLSGWAVSGGRFVGRAHRVTGPEGPIGRDEVLVASATDPSWLPVLLGCGAMVLERGGPLSHAAILARELGLPAVCNVPGAVAALDGRMVVVDGDAGTVTVIDGVDGSAESART